MGARVASVSILRKFAGVVALAAILGETAVAGAKARVDVSPGSMAVPLGGIGCSQSGVQSTFPLGGVFRARPDVPGQHGNEIKNIAGVFRDTANNAYETRFSGFLYEAFDGSAAFEPMTDENSRVMQFLVKMPQGNFDLAPWLRSALQLQQEPKGKALGFVLAPALASLTSQNRVPASIRWCFKRSWDGKDYR